MEVINVIKICNRKFMHKDSLEVCDVGVSWMEYRKIDYQINLVVQMQDSPLFAYGNINHLYEFFQTNKSIPVIIYGCIGVPYTKAKYSRMLGSEFMINCKDKEAAISEYWRLWNNQDCHDELLENKYKNQEEELITGTILMEWLTPIKIINTFREAERWISEKLA